MNPDILQTAAVPMTAPSHVDLAEAALKVLAARGQEAPHEEGHIWSWSGAGSDGTRVDLSCTGPELPESCPDMVVHKSQVAEERPWKGRYRLVLTSGNIAFDIFWTPDQPVRFMTFSRGDWEDALMEVAGG